MRRHLSIAAIVLTTTLTASVLLAAPTPLKHGTGYVAPTLQTSWVNSDRSSNSIGTLDPTVTDISTHALIDLRYDKGLRSSPANRPSNRFVWKSRFDNENGTNATGNFLHDMCVRGQLGSPTVWDCWPTEMEIADAGATGDPRVLAYYQAIPTDPAQAVPMPLPGKPCGVSVQDIGGGLGLRLVNNTSPLCVNPGAPVPPTTPPTVPPAVLPAVPVTPPAVPPSTPTCDTWRANLMALLSSRPATCGTASTASDVTITLAPGQTVTLEQRLYQ